MKIAALRPHFSFDASKEKSSRPVEKINVSWASGCAGSPDRGSPQTLPTKSGNLLPGAEDPLLFDGFPPQIAEVRWLSGRKTERLILLFPRVTRIPRL